MNFELIVHVFFKGEKSIHVRMNLHLLRNKYALCFEARISKIRTVGKDDGKACEANTP